MATATKKKKEEKVQVAPPAEPKANPKELIESALEKIKKNDYTVYFYSPPMSVASGGVSVLFRYAKVLAEAGFKVKVIYEPRDDKKASYDKSVKTGKPVTLYEKWNTDWLGNLTEGVKIQCLGGGAEVEFTDGTKESAEILNLNPEDFFFIPEGFPNIMQNTANLPCKRIVFAQSWYYILNALGVGQTWQQFGITDVVAVSDGIVEYIHAIMQGLKIKQFKQSIDRELFKPSKLTDKAPMIGFIPGRSQDAAVKTLNVIKTFYAFFPHYRWIRMMELKGLSRENFAERVSNCAMVLYTDEIAGFGTFPLEAMASYTHVVGWLPLGSKEFANNDNGFWASNGDVFQLAEMLGYACDSWLSGNLDTDVKMAKYEETLANYTPDKEREALLKIQEEYKNERIEELQAIAEQQAVSGPTG